MSFGNDSPMTNMMRSAVGTFDSVLGPAFKSDTKPNGATPAPVSSAPPPSLVTRPVSQDTPGRHKSLLGR